MGMPIVGLWPQADGRVVVELGDDAVVLTLAEASPTGSKTGGIQLGVAEAPAWLDLQAGTLVASDGLRMRGLQQDALPEALEACPVNGEIAVLMDAVGADFYRDAKGGHWMVGEDGLVIAFGSTLPKPT